MGAPERWHASFEIIQQVTAVSTPQYHLLIVVPYFTPACPKMYPQSLRLVKELSLVNKQDP